ncbi:MAG: hypothetical protein DRQ78_01195 [Epsilonproteobacteria bacterium]|nr:MAG: hypothetical protein DRQ78_01195 [Campylobacterota bacterium]
MAIIKDVILIGASFTTGYLVGASDDTATKVKIENFLHLVDHRYQETKKLVVTTLDSIEGVDVEE